MVRVRASIRSSRSRPKPVQARHHDISQDEIRRFVPGRGQGRQPVRDREHVIAVSQQAADVIPHVGIVIGPKDSRAATGRCCGGLAWS